MEGDRLGMDAQRMRETGYATVDLLVDELTDTTAPPLRRATPAEMRARLSGPPPEGPQDFGALLERLRVDVLAHMERSFHPGFFAFIPSNGTWPGALGDFVAAAMNIYAGHWSESAGPSQVELEVLGWFRDWIGYTSASSGVLVSGGSAANMTAMACARETLVGAMRDDVVAYVSDQAHSSFARAARVLGFRPDQLRVLPTDARHRMVPRLLEAAIEADRRAGRRPLFAAMAAGSTNTGAVDPMADIAAICRKHDVWCHADAAYGGFAVLSERGRATLEGLALADSVTMDPHKWLYQPFECGAVLVRDGAALRSAFSVVPPYLEDASGAGDETDFADLGIQLTRSTRALKVWLSVHAFGLAAFRGAIDRSLDLAAHAAARVRESDVLDLACEPSLGIVCLRRRFEGLDEDAAEAANARLASAAERAGVAFLSTTRLRGRHALRLCVLNHTTGPGDVDRTLDFLERAEVDLRAAAPARGAERAQLVGASWGGARADAALLGGLALFGGAGAAELDAAAALATVRDVAADEAVVEQWGLSRDFFVLLDGGAEVRVDGCLVRTLRPGDPFGEIGALDWGRGYGYSRAASVVTTAPSRLLVFADGSLNELMRRVPAVRRAVLALVDDHLPQA